ncbi:MAG: thiamine pyrophosphate-binding protein [Chloroflexi bacterium]|nr:thiamine pyrophosphate-binding protein [Chloroflexota bacterium]
MPNMTAGHAVVESLVNEGCKYAFGIVGVSFLDIADGFYGRNDIRFITTRHEQGAACMASAYARISGEPGVCLATGGPGAANLVGGLYNAFMAQAPVIAISGAAGQGSTYREAGQELDHVPLFRPITKLAMSIPRAERIPELMRHAFRVAMAGKKGPVFIDFPTDLMQKRTIDADILPPEVYRAHQRPAGDPALVRKAAQLLRQARHPLLIAGGGVTESGATQEAVELAELLSIPMVTSYRRNDALPNAHGLYVGPYGPRGAAETATLSARADVILAVGTRLQGFANYLQSGAVSRDARIIQVEIDEKEIGRNCPVHVGILGDAKSVLLSILEALRAEGAEGGDPAWRREAEELKAKRRQRLNAEGRISGTMISPRRVYAELRKVITPETVMILDAGACAAYGYDRLDFQTPHTFISPPTGGLGYAIPEAIGAKLARPHSPVIAINGDGGFLFNAQELETAVREKVPTITLVMNNNIYGSEKALQQAQFGDRFVGADLTNPRFDKLAELYGAKGYYVDRVEQLAEVVKIAMSNEVSSVIEVPVDPNDMPRGGGGG